METQFFFFSEDDFQFSKAHENETKLDKDNSKRSLTEAKNL